MAQEITNPVEGLLNLFGNQYKYCSGVVAQMRAENKPHQEIDTEICFMGHIQQKIYNLCQENQLDFTTVLNKFCDEPNGETK